MIPPLLLRFSFSISLGLLLLGIAGGCERESAVDSGASAEGTPKIGLPPATPETYKPVLGKRGGRFVRDTLGEPKSFNPITSSETSTTDYTNRIFQGLTDVDPYSGETMPLLAEKWEVNDDGVTWTFHLRKDIKFNDGSPMTARDVAFTWNDLVYDLSRPNPEKSKPRWQCSMRDALTFGGKIVKVEALDDYTVRFVTPGKIAIFLLAGGEVPVLPKATYSAFVANGSFGQAMGANSSTTDIVGTGPYVLKEYRRGERIVLERNPHYWKHDPAGTQLPYIDRQDWLILRDINTMLLNFQQGYTDYYVIQSGKEIPLLRPYQQSENFTLYQLGPDMGNTFVTFNMNEDAAKAGKVPAYKVKWFRDRRFRQAIAYAINKNQLINNVLRRLGHPIGAPFTKAAGPFKFEDIQPYEYNPAKAKALLAEMGLIDRDGDGILEDEQGHKVSFTINTNSGNLTREQTADFVRSDLRSIGIECNTLFLQFNSMVSKLLGGYDWECFVFALTGSTEPHFGSNIWKSDARLHMWWPEQKSPGTDWEKRIDEIFEEGAHELDPAKRKKLYHEWIEIVQREQPFVYLYCAERVHALRNKFGNVFPSAIAQRFGTVHNDDELFVK